MQREIKFRAFQKSTRIMRTILEINFEGADYDLRYIKIDNGKWLYPEDGDFILMQFTGLKDKIGNKVYDGDIVSYYDFTTQVCWDEQYLQWFLLWEEDSDPMNIGMETEIEIIGNIHENGNLLNTK